MSNTEMDLQAKNVSLEKEIRKLTREVSHLKYAVAQEKFTSTTLLNHQKSSTFIQRERERYLALLLANSPNVILFLNKNKRIDFCTDYFIAKTGFANVADILGRTLAEVFAPYLEEHILTNLLGKCRYTLDTGTTTTLDLAVRFTPDGAPEEFDGQIVPLKNEQTGTDGLMLVFQDITDIKRSREEAVAANKAKSEFLSTMSHEIRTPMNAIMGMTAIGKNAADIRRKDYAFEKIESASVHLLGVINDILDISKIESGKMELSHVNFEFSQMINRIKDVVSLKIKEKKQAFSVEIDPAIPAVLCGDDQRLAQVIANLLSNAMKFTAEAGSITLHIERLSCSGGECVIKGYVKDSGIGISREEQKKLFTAFQQAQAGTSRQFGGTGLGLAISKRILLLMRGDIWVESKRGAGSTFFFTAALATPNTDADAGHTKTDTGAGGGVSEQDFSGKHLLVTDDMEINLEIIAAVLESTRAAIDTACSGREAFDMFAANPGKYDLILMDMQMPEVDGLQATRMIRASGLPGAETIPIVAMTANVFREDIEKCLNAGMNNHIGKPVDVREVFKVLTYYLNR